MGKIKIIGSFSGGESSSVMVEELLKFDKDKYEVKFIFINTSREDERTLIFVDKMDKYYNLNLIWLEAVVNPIKSKGIRHRVTDFNGAKRNGEVFEPWISKYGIHGIKNPGCSRDLKHGCCTSWAKSIGWGDALTAIGFRRDEPKRVNFIKAEIKKQIYPLYTSGYVKNDIKRICALRPFQLGLKEWEGNCKLCFKKSNRKLLTQLKYDPSSADWVIDMQNTFSKNPITGEDMYMFRGKNNIYDLIELSKQDFEEWQSQFDEYSNQFDIEMDEQEDCSESCEQ